MERVYFRAKRGTQVKGLKQGKPRTAGVQLGENTGYGKRRGKKDRVRTEHRRVGPGKGLWMFFIRKRRTTDASAEVLRSCHYTKAEFGN